jgi:hypothetical protein
VVVDNADFLRGGDLEHVEVVEAGLVARPYSSDGSRLFGLLGGGGEFGSGRGLGSNFVYRGSSRHRDVVESFSAFLKVVHLGLCVGVGGGASLMEESRLFDNYFVFGLR